MMHEDNTEMEERLIAHGWTESEHVRHVFEKRDWTYYPKETFRHSGGHETYFDRDQVWGTDTLDQLIADVLRKHKAKFWDVEDWMLTGTGDYGFTIDVEELIDTLRELVGTKD